ncbi:MAG: excinuclease ABC subunit UvrC [Mycoplasma sp.]
MNQVLSYKLSKMPHQPGCYLWKNRYNQIIYIGKATDLYKRTHQYFLPNRDIKTKKLVENIADVDFITVNNENESLILENNLIKQYKPKYNILLKEGSNYPYIAITKETHPRLIYTRNLSIPCYKFYGPFASSKANRYEVFNLLQRLFRLRKCYKLPKQKCLYYDLGQCLGPCINQINPSEYETIIKEIDQFFNGNTKQLINSLIKKEKEFANNFRYEEANETKAIIDGINEIKNKQTINFVNNQSVDVIGYHVDNKYITIVIFSFKDGKLVAKNQQINEINHDDLNELMQSYLMQYYLENNMKPKTCYVSLNKHEANSLKQVLGINFLNPVKGKFKQILISAINNAKAYYEANYYQHLRTKELKETGFNDLKAITNLDNLSLIHVFDMSNLQQDAKVGGMIALEHGEFNKEMYRKFIIKNKAASSDLDYTEEVITRQYQNMIKNNDILPNLIIADGGALQVNVIKKTLKTLKLENIIPVIGLVKNNKHQTEKLYLDDNNVIALDKKSPLYLFLLRIQDEVHRFVISFFRVKKQASLFRSQLNEIKGLGKKKIDLLLKNYDHIGKIKEASINELSQYVGEKLAMLIKQELK